jgi:hypothetical protein
MKLPQPFATSELYASGPDVGTPTKVDPASTANGFVRGTAAAAQHVNYLVHPLAETVARSFAVHALCQRVLTGDPQDDLTDGLAAVATNLFSPVLLVKASTVGVARCMGATYDQVNSGVLSDVGGSIKCVARRGNNLVLIGAGTNQNCSTSASTPTAWTAGGSTGLLGTLAWACGTDTNVIALGTAGGIAFSADNGATWANPGGGDSASDVVTGGGFTSCAALDGDIAVAAGLDSSGDAKFAVTTDAGVTWAAASGAVPNAATHADAGFVTSAGKDATELYHVGHRSGNNVDIAASSDGDSWTARATFVSDEVVTGVRIWQCEVTDLLVVGVSHSNSTELRASTDAGVTWAKPERLRGVPLESIAVAQGRVFSSKGAYLFGSDGVGSA